MKRVLSMLLILSMIFTMAFSTAGAATLEGTATLTITPDKTSIVSTGGDVEVTYTIKITPPEGKAIGAFSFTLGAPDGVTLPSAFKVSGVTKIAYIDKANMEYNQEEESGIFATYGYTPASGYFAAAGTTESRRLTSEAGLIKITVTIAADKVGSFALTASDFIAGVDGSGDKYTSKVISNPVNIVKELTGEQAVSIEVPQTGGTPQTAITGANFTGTVTWSPAVSGKFEKEKTYTANVILTPNEGYKFATGSKAKLNGTEIINLTVKEDGTASFSKTFPTTVLPAYTGDAASTPTKNSQTINGVTLNPVTVTGENVEYGYKTPEETEYGHWQSETIFTGLSAGQYTFVAKVAANESHAAGGVSVSGLDVTIYGKPVVTYSNDSISNLVVGTAIAEVTPSVSGGAGGGTYAVTIGNLPEGLTLNSSTGVISGNPAKKTDANSVEITYTDKDGNNADAITIRYGTVAGKANTLSVSQDDITYGETVNPTVETNGNAAALLYKQKNESDSAYKEEKPKAAGEYTVKASSTGSDTVADATATADFVISPKPITVTVNAAERAYGEVNPAFSGSVAEGALVSGDEYSGLGMIFSSSANASSNVGTYDVTGSGTNTNYQITVDGKDKLNVKPAKFTVAVSNSQTIKVGSGLEAITVTKGVKALGVNEEVLCGNFSWFTDESCRNLAEDSSINTLAVGAKKNLYWKFTLEPANGNYTETGSANTGKTTFEIVEGDPQTLSFKNTEIKKVYGDTSFTQTAVNDRNDGGTITYSSSNSDVASVDASTGAVTILKPGSAEITATAAAVPGKYAKGTASYSINVAAKTVSVTKGTYTVNKTYDKSAAAGTGTGVLNIDGILDSDNSVEVVVDDIGIFESENAGSYFVVITLSLTGEGADKYVLKEEHITVPGKISAKPVTPTIEDISALTFNGNAHTPSVVVKDGTDVIDSTQYKAEYSNNIDAGTATVSITSVNGANYTWDTPVSKNFIISKAADLTLNAQNTSVKAGYTGNIDVKISGIPSNAKITKLTVGSITGTSSIIGEVLTDASAGAVNIAVNGSGTAGNAATIPVTVEMKNYNDSAVNIVVSLIEKDIPELTVSDISVTYSGNAVADNMIKGTAKFNNNKIEGTWSFKAGQALTNVSDSGEKTVVFTPQDDVNYATVEKTITVTIKKATPTVSVGCTKITEKNKTLADAALTRKSSSVEGILTWDYADTTVVTQGTGYGWTFTPNDTANYETVKGKVVPWAKSSASGGNVPSAQKPTIDFGDGAKVVLSTDGTRAIITVKEEYELVDVTVNGVSKGAVTELTGLKTGDKVVVTTTKKTDVMTNEAIIEAVESQRLVTRSKIVTTKGGKKAVCITWVDKNGNEVDFDGVEIFRSLKKNSGYGKKPIYISKSDKYINTAVKAGKKYYYKVRGYVIVDGEKVYTEYSSKAYRTVK